MKFVILAAGKGTRLGMSHPKPLTKLKTGETISGFNKICYYNKLGSVYTINIPNTSIHFLIGISFGK